MKATIALLPKLAALLIVGSLCFRNTVLAQPPPTKIMAPEQPSAHFRSLPICKDVGQQVKLILNTGTAGAAPPVADPFWRVVAPNALTPFTTTPVNSPSLWLPNSASEKWIQPSPAGNPVIFPLATYVYSTQFVTPVDPYFYTGITVTGDVAADDGFAVKLNGIPLSLCSPGSTPATWCFHSWKPITPPVDWHAFTRTGGFLNTLTVEVKNTGASPSGLIVRAQVVATCSKCTTPPPPPIPPCGGNPSTC